VRREVVLLAQHDLAAAAGEVAGDAGAVDAAADDADVARRHALDRTIAVCRSPLSIEVRFRSFSLFSFRFSRLSAKRKRGFLHGGCRPGD
jgi:hypothetical protein